MTQVTHKKGKVDNALWKVRNLPDMFGTGRVEHVRPSERGTDPTGRGLDLDCLLG